MQVKIDTDGKQTSIQIDEGEAAPTERGEDSEAETPPPEDRYDRETARDAGGPPATMLGPDGEATDETVSTGGMTEVGGTNIHSAGAFRSPDSA